QNTKVLCNCRAKPVYRRRGRRLRLAPFGGVAQPVGEDISLGEGSGARYTAGSGASRPQAAGATRRSSVSCSSMGRAPLREGGGRGFDSPQLTPILSYGCEP